MMSDFLGQRGVSIPSDLNHPAVETHIFLGVLDPRDLDGILARLLVVTITGRRPDSIAPGPPDI